MYVYDHMYTPYDRWRMHIRKIPSKRTHRKQIKEKKNKNLFRFERLRNLLCDVICLELGKTLSYVK